MIVNGIDIIKKYNNGVIWLSQTIKPRTVINYTNWLDNAYDPVEYRENSYQDFEICIDMVIKGSSMLECETIRSELLKDFNSGIIQLDMTFSHRFTLKSEAVEMLNKWKYRYKITLTAFNKLGPQEILGFTGTEYEFDVKGTAKTPAVLLLSSDIGLNDLTIKGVTEEDIVISQVQSNSSIVIDGEKCCITENEENILNKSELWEFPELSPGSTKITLSNECTVQVSYYPRYL